MIVPSATARAPTALDVANVADRGNGRKAVGMLMHPRKATRKGVLLGGASSGGSSGGDSWEHGGGVIAAGHWLVGEHICVNQKF